MIASWEAGRHRCQFASKLAAISHFRGNRLELTEGYLVLV